MIIQTIIEILKTEDSVFINDLGQFTKHFVSAQLKGDLLYPPQNKVKFNSKSDGNGFAFILKLSEKLQKRIPEANAEVKDWVEKLKSAVENNKSVSFNNFGTFFINAKGELGFDSAAIIELNGEYEGMEPIEVKPIEKKGYSETTPFVRERKETISEATPENFEPGPSPISVSEEAEIKKVPIEHENSEVTKIVEPVKEAIPTESVQEEIVSESKTETTILIETVSEEKEIHRKKKNYKGAIIGSVILLILLVLGAFCYLEWVPIKLTFKDIIHKYFDKKQVVTVMEPGPVSEYQIFGQTMENNCCKEESISPPFSPGYQQKIVDKQYNQSDSIDTEEPANTQETLVTSPSSTEYQKTDFQKGKYYVIAGSFISENDAALHIKERSLQHLSPLLLYQEGNNRIRVCIGIYDDENEANAYAKKFNSNYWVLK